MQSAFRDLISLTKVLQVRSRYTWRSRITFHMLRSNESKMRLVRSYSIFSLGVKFKSLLCLVMLSIWLCSWKSVFLDRNKKVMLQDKTWKQIIIIIVIIVIMPTERSFSTSHKNKQASHTHIHFKALYVNCKLLPRKVHVFILVDIF